MTKMMAPAKPPTKPLKKTLSSLNSKKASSVLIEYCGAAGYESQYKGARGAIQTAFPDAEIQGLPVPGKKGGFEIKANGKLVYSSLNGDEELDSSNLSKMMGRLKRVMEED